MNNCDYKILSSNNIGNVLYCNKCGEMMIGVGTFILKFKLAQSKMFLRALITTRQDYRLKRNNSIDKVFLKTPVNNLVIALNSEELDLSIDLIEYALLKVEIEDLITVGEV